MCGRAQIARERILYEESWWVEQWLSDAAVFAVVCLNMQSRL